LGSRKLNLDVERQRQFQKELDERVKDLASRYLRENVKWIGSSLNPNNFSLCKQRLVEVIVRCRGIGFEVAVAEEATLLTDLKAEYEKVVRAAFEREEQARIKAQIREEQLREREIERELKQLEREREAIKTALEKALADARGQHTEEVARLQAKLAEAEGTTDDLPSAAHQVWPRVRHLKHRGVRGRRFQNWHDPSPCSTRVHTRIEQRFCSVPFRCPHDDFL
jgi:hypothetical protein